MISRVKKNDTVMVLSGKFAGKQGTVIDIQQQNDKIMVKNIAIATRHIKARKAGQAAGIKKEETFINISKVMPICPSCKKPCRVNMKFLENSKKARMCNQCNEIF